MAGVKAGRVHLCRVARNTVWSRMAGDAPLKEEDTGGLSFIEFGDDDEDEDFDVDEERRKQDEEFDFSALMKQADTKHKQTTPPQGSHCINCINYIIIHHTVFIMSFSISNKTEYLSSVSWWNVHNSE